MKEDKETEEEVKQKSGENSKIKRAQNKKNPKA